MVKIVSVFFMVVLLTPSWGAPKKPSTREEAVPLSPPSAPDWIDGSFTLGSDLTFWSLDDSFSGSLITLETSRNVPLFYKFRLEIDDLFGLKGRLDLFLDQILNPLGLFAPDLSLGTGGTSGGAMSEWSIPLPFWTALSFLTGEDFGEEPLPLVIAYKYRVFRWDSKIIKKWLDPVVDYYDEKGERKLFAPGQSISTGSQWHDVTAGLFFSDLEDLGMGLFMGVEWWSLLAPTLLGLSERDGYTHSAELLMQTWNRYLGARFNYIFGFDGQNMELLREEEIAAGGTLGMTAGGFSGSNEYFQGPSSLGFSLFAGLHVGFSFQPWEGSEGFLILGAEGTFSLLNTFGAANDPGKILKDLPYHAVGSENVMPAGLEVDVNINRWENYGGPYLKLGLKF